VMDVSGSSREKNLMPGIDGMCLSKTKMWNAIASTDNNDEQSVVAMTCVEEA
jgi:hypothetical protein